MRAVVTLVFAVGCGFPGAAATDDAPADDTSTDDVPTDDAPTDDTPTDDSSTDDAMTIDAALDPEIDATPAAVDWWSEDYPYRRQITVTAASALVDGYSVGLVANTKLIVDAGHAHASGRDWRIVRRTVIGGVVEWTEIDRWVEDVPARSFDQPATRTWFRLPRPLPASASDGDTYVYYGAGNPSVPARRDLNQVFLFADDFEGDLAKWTANGKGEMFRVVTERAAGAKGLELKPGATSAAGVHADIELPRTPVLFTRWVRQAQTNASLGDARGFDRPYAQRTKVWVEDNLRLATELDSANAMQVWAVGTLNNWFPNVGQNTWHEFDAVYDSVANTVRCRGDGGSWTNAIPIRYTQDAPIRSIALEGEGQVGTFWLDNFIIRHVVTTEPTATLGDEEALPSVP